MCAWNIFVVDEFLMSGAKQSGHRRWTDSYGSAFDLYACDDETTAAPLLP